MTINISGQATKRLTRAQAAEIGAKKEDAGEMNRRERARGRAEAKAKRQRSPVQDQKPVNRVTRPPGCRLTPKTEGAICPAGTI